MSDTNTDIDDFRYQHHLEHRGNANNRIFWAVWLCISIFVLIKVGRTIFASWRRRLSRAHQFQPLLPGGSSPLKHCTAFICAVALIPFAQLLRRNDITLPLGRLLLPTAYFIFVASLLLVVDAPISTPHFIDDVAFRAAWITITQIPLVFFLSSKHGFINFLIDTSYDKLSWLHRWVGRMIFISATVHIAIMKSSISATDIFLSDEKGATIIRYGIGSYLLLIWIAVSSILPLRKWSYRAFYVNHWASTFGFLMVILQHVPKHATAPIYMAFGFAALDKILVIVSFIRTNISVRLLNPRLAKFQRAPGRAMLVAGYPVEMLEPHNLSVPAEVEESTTMIRVCNVPISWRPGQHIRLYIPALGAFELHPFTPANCSSVVKPPPLPPRRSQDVERQGSEASMISSKQSTDLLLMISAHTGFTRRLKEFHTEWLRLPCPNSTVSNTATTLTAYVDGPYGSPPNWEEYENLVLIATSTGVSFSLSILDYLEQLCSSEVSKLRTQSIRFVWTVRHIDPQFEASVAELLRRYSTMMRDSGVLVETEFHVTCPQSEIKFSMMDIDPFSHLRPRLSRYGSGDRMLTIRNPDEIYDEWEKEELEWAEIEALDEMQMKDVDPFVDAHKVSSDYTDESETIGTYEGGGYAGSEASTLLNGANDMVGKRESNTFSEVRLTIDETAALNAVRPTSSPHHSPFPFCDKKSQKKTCQCTIVQYQRQKLYNPAKPSFDTITYGARPNITSVVTSALNNSQQRKSMVATCTNSSVLMQANKAVSNAKLAFARGKRAMDVEIFSENFS